MLLTKFTKLTLFSSYLYVCMIGISVTILWRFFFNKVISKSVTVKYSYTQINVMKTVDKHTLKSFARQKWYPRCSNLVQYRLAYELLITKYHWNWKGSSKPHEIEINLKLSAFRQLNNGSCLFLLLFSIYNKKEIFVDKSLLDFPIF